MTAEPIFGMLISMTSPKIFIIVLNWNNWHETKECLGSLAKVSYPNYEVLVVDNGSSERPPINSLTSPQAPLLSKERGVGGEVAKLGRAELLCNDSNLGFAGGNNVGIKYALAHGADYIMLLNNDTIVAPDFLTELVRAADGSPSYGILGSRIYKYGTDDVVFGGGKINKWLNMAGHAKNYELGIMNHETDYITGAAMLIRRKVIEKIGLMREEYFLYYEDVDWCLRARKAGYKCLAVNTSRVWHKVSATTKEGSPSYIYYHTRNALMLAKFNGNILQKVATYLWGLGILVKQIIKFSLLPSKRVWARAMTKGVLDFYSAKYGKYENRH